jgi:anthranilate synthase/aminodeoxychorismate synthase-like glutamine amidotransferase
MLVVIDNYDSFTYNLVQYLGELNAQPQVFRNDQITMAELCRLAPTHLVISPGPGTPLDGGISNEAIRRLAGRTAILGVCLGHQCIAHVFGGRVERAERLVHGKTSQISHSGQGILHDLPCPFTATRYHSLLVNPAVPDSLQVTAHSEQNEVMALQHRDYAIFGVQFHPESILTQDGMQLLRNFLSVKGGQRA